MRNALAMTTVAAAASLSIAATVQNAGTAQERAPLSAAAPAMSGLSDLEAVTRSCSMAALNAAARRAATAPSDGKYQFSYFNLISDSHHAQYEVHFTSNYEGEPVLKYCVEIYCQQGWDPKTAKATITVMGDARRRAAAGSHVPACGQMHTPARRPTKR